MKLVKLGWVIASLILSVTSYAKSSVSALTAQECRELTSHNVITKDNPVACQRLQKVIFSHLNMQGSTQTGQLIVLDVIAPQVAKLMDALLKRQFIIDKAQGMAMYRGDDKKSMSDNNTSAFNGRAITNGKSWSLHAYGVALDINPVQNPFVDIAKNGSAQISPPQSARSMLNRLEIRPNKLPRAGLVEPVVELFAAHGFFIWGGDWNYPIDYQHFQIGPRHYVEKLVALPVTQARDLFNRHIAAFQRCTANKSQRAYCVEQALAIIKAER